VPSACGSSVRVISADSVSPPIRARRSSVRSTTCSTNPRRASCSAQRREQNCPGCCVAPRRRLKSTASIRRTTPAGASSSSAPPKRSAVQARSADSRTRAWTCGRPATEPVGFESGRGRFPAGESSPPSTADPLPLTNDRPRQGDAGIQRDLQQPVFEQARAGMCATAHRMRSAATCSRCWSSASGLALGLRSFPKRRRGQARLAVRKPTRSLRA
jgi:hypothetical protein